jgi:phosphoglucosamine mutase
MAYKMNMSPKEERTSQRLFGTDGVRGVANVHPMTAEVAMQLGRALAYLIRNGPHRHRVIIGKDTRLSGYMLEQALAAGITSMGVDVWLTGPLPTPGISNLTTSMRADAGAVISASHNPYQDNGIKFFWRDGFKLPDETEAKLEELLSTGAMDTIRPTADNVGRAVRLEDARGRYIVFLKATFPRELTLEGMIIVVDCANGAAYKTAPSVLEELGAKVIPLGVSPDGKNINEKCGAMHPEGLSRAVVEHGAHLGLALDGDADRLIVVDEKGKVVDGDAIMAICTGELVAREQLKKKTLVATVMSNIGLERAVARWGVKVARTRVGDRYVVEEMRKQGYNLGGEQSGHLIFLDQSTTGDGTLAGRQRGLGGLGRQRGLGGLGRQCGLGGQRGLGRRGRRRRGRRRPRAGVQRRGGLRRGYHLPGLHLHGRRLRQREHRGEHGLHRGRRSLLQRRGSLRGGVSRRFRPFPVERAEALARRSSRSYPSTGRTRPRGSRSTPSFR